MKIVKIRLSIVEIILFLTQKAVKITKAHIFMAKHDHFVLNDFFANFFVCNEAHKTTKFNEKTKLC